ncbi:MAG: signal peptidase II [Myxococcota bacterium]
MQRWTLFAVIASLVVVLDQASKLMAVQYLTPGLSGAEGLLDTIGTFYGGVEHPCAGATRLECPVRTVVDGFWYWRYVENPGAAWGFLRSAPESVRVPFFLLVPVIAAVFILTLYRRLGDGQWLMRVALALVFGGALGNFIDRVHLSYVIDFIDMYIGSYHWPTYNIADSAISVGVGLMMLEWLMDAIRGKSTAASAEASS